MGEHTSFMPHGICYLWQPELVWLHAISDLVIAAAYFAIPPALIYLVVRARSEARALGMPGPARGLPYEWVYLAFGLFIVACGATHLMGVWTIWEPRYWLSGGVKVVTALASVATAVALPPLLPRAVALFREARISEIQHAQLSQLAAIVEHSGDGIFTEDLNGIVTSWNRGAEKLYGYTRDEMIGQSILRAEPEDRADEGHRLLDRVRAGESVTHYETTRIRKDGSTVDVALSMSPLFDSMGRVIGASAIARDMTERKREEQRQLELVRARTAREEAEKLAAELAELNTAKSEFLAVMSHELRTPLNAVVGYTDLIETGIGGGLTADQRAYVGRIRNGAYHLRGLIDQILQYTRLEAGLETNIAVPVDLPTVTHEAVAIVAPAAEAKQLPISVVMEEGTTVLSDPVYVRQIVINLLSNAIKFTSRGAIGVSARREGDRILLQVTDPGTGIPPEHVERIFEPFWQIGRGLARTAEGMGLGLTVTRRLARLMGGDVTVESEVGKGSTFTVSLPAA